MNVPLPQSYLEQGLTAAHAANLQFDNIKDFDSQLAQIDTDTENANEIHELKRQQQRAVRLFNKYIEMGGIFFDRIMQDAESEPLLSGEGIERSE